MISLCVPDRDGIDYEACMFADRIICVGSHFTEDRGFAKVHARAFLAAGKQVVWMRNMWPSWKQCEFEKSYDSEYIGFTVGGVIAEAAMLHCQSGTYNEPHGDFNYWKHDHFTQDQQMYRAKAYHDAGKVDVVYHGCGSSRPDWYGWSCAYGGREVLSVGTYYINILHDKSNPPWWWRHNNVTQGLYVGNDGLQVTAEHFAGLNWNPVWLWPGHEVEKINVICEQISKMFKKGIG